MTYLPEDSKVVYRSKDGKEEKIFDALEWLVPTKSGCSHVPNKGEQMVKYYGHYSNVSRGKRKKQNQDELIPSILEPVEDPDFSGDGSSKEYRRNWSRLIQKIYQTDPLCCPRCQGRMRILAFIEKPEIIKKILQHLGLWERKARPPPRANASPPDLHIDYSDSQLPPCEDYLYSDPDYPVEASV
jgi:hypothetical protein